MDSGSQRNDQTMPVIHAALPPDQVATLLEQHCLEYYAMLGQLPGCEIHRAPAVTWFASGLPIDMFNGVCGANWTPADADAGIVATLQAFRQRGLPMLWHYGSLAQPADLADRLAAHGCVPVEDEPGMAADLAQVSLDTATPAELQIAPVSDAATLRAWMGVWGVDAPAHLLDLAAELYSRAGFAADRPLHHLLGYVDGQPVACAALFEALGITSVQHVVTRPAVRRRGYGTAPTQAVMRAARARGYRYCVLTSSALGMGVYQQLGFRPYTVMRTWTLPTER